MKTIGLIAVRTGSSRLPAKALMPILGKPMIERMIERVRRAKSIDEIVIATTHLPEDDRLEELANRLGAKCFRGSVDDVLDRMAGAVADSGCDRVIELLGDNPLVHGNLIDDVTRFFEKGRYDYAVNVTHEQPHAAPDVAKWPIGIRVEVYHPEVIERCAREATSPENHEHSTSYIGEHPELFNLGYFEAKDDWSPLHHPDWTFAVNYQQNFELVRSVFEACYPEKENFWLDDIVELMERRPELLSLMGAPKA